VVPVEVECWSHSWGGWVDVDPDPLQEPVELIFWVSKWVREGQRVRVTLGAED